MDDEKARVADSVTKAGEEIGEAKDFRHDTNKNWVANETVIAKVCESGFDPKLGKVGTVGIKIGPSGQYRGWLWSKGGF